MHLVANVDERRQLLLLLAAQEREIGEHYFRGGLRLHLEKPEKGVSAFRMYPAICQIGKLLTGKPWNQR